MLAPGWALTTLGTAIVGGAGFGFGAGFSSTIMSGGSLGQAFQAGLIGAVIGGISGGIARGLGSIPGAEEMFTSGHLAQTAGHAVLGGTVSEIRGDSFASGALAAGISAGFAPAVNMIGGGRRDYMIARVAASAAIGGTAAEIGGGKFANGAVTAAFLRLYNAERHFFREAETDPSTLQKYQGKYDIAAAIKALRGAAAKFNYPGVDPDEVIAALESALKQGKIMMADASWDRSLMDSKSPAAFKNGYIVISDRVKIGVGYFPKYFAHEGLHRADFLAGRLLGTGSSFTLSRELRGFGVQHAFAIPLGIPDPIMRKEDIIEAYGLGR